MRKIKVALAGTDPLSVVGLACHLESCREIEVLPADRRRADVVVVAADRLSPELTAAIAESAAPVVFVAGAPGVADLAECRVVAVLPGAGLTSEWLVTAVLAASVSDGDIPVQPGAGKSDVDIPAARLTQREEEVLRLLAEGLGMAEIAERLSYSERTVKNVFYGVTARLKLRNRPHAVAYALRAGLI